MVQDVCQFGHGSRTQWDFELVWSGGQLVLAD